MAGNAEMNKKKKRDRVGTLLYVAYVLMLCASVFLFLKIIGIQLFFKPDSEIAKRLTPVSKLETVEAARGNILAEDGRLLAMTYPEYTIHLDCAAPKEQLWADSLDALCNGLSRIFKDRTPEGYRSLLKDGRKKSSRYLKIGVPVDVNTLHEIEKLPILRKGKYRGGLIVESRNKRHYPYGKLGRRTIGFVRGTETNVSNTHVGLEGKFDYVLHGQDGKMWTKQTDYGQVQDFDSTFTKAQDGLDIRTTINIDYQSIADSALREGIQEDSDIEGGCLILMDVKTGAIRAMVNLSRDSNNDGELSEISNLAVGRIGEPGSVFKSTNLMIMLENGYIKSLDETIPTNHGVLKGYPYESDVHITDYERQHHTTQIPIIEGFKVSSNYMFRYLAVTHYGKRPAKYIENLYMYRLGEAFDFDLDGLATPTLPDPKSKYWSKEDLTGAATGYAVGETPLHILTFYNAIAGKGKMMKPYLVEDIEKDGVVKTRRGPSILNGSICSKATADTLTRALIAVTEEGTAKRLKGAKCTVAGKTGTSRVALETGGYFKDGMKKNQGTFVGFFPAEDPQYSIICVVYSYLSARSFYGGTIPAAAVRKVVDQIYDIDPYWQSRLSAGQELAVMEAPAMPEDTGDKESATLPNLKGLGLNDAVFILENMGMKCSYSGVGHVRTQEPAAGSRVRKGTNVSIELQ